MMFSLGRLVYATTWTDGAMSGDTFTLMVTSPLVTEMAVILAIRAQMIHKWTVLNTAIKKVFLYDPVSGKSTVRTHLVHPELQPLHVLDWWWLLGPRSAVMKGKEGKTHSHFWVSVLYCRWTWVSFKYQLTCQLTKPTLTLSLSTLDQDNNNRPVHWSLMNLYTRHNNYFFMCHTPPCPQLYVYSKS